MDHSVTANGQTARAADGAISTMWEGGDRRPSAYGPLERLVRDAKKDRNCPQVW